MTEKGLYDKFTVQKADGTSVDPEAEYFVLRIDNDKHALHAVMDWAIKTGHRKLFDDLTDKYLLGSNHSLLR